MSDRNLYLRPDVQVEALFNQWPAVAIMTAPATAAMFIANSHLRIMKSYLLSPEMHAAASEDPALIGGPFINYEEDQTELISELLKTTAREQHHMIEFAAAVKCLDDLLRQEARGYSLEPLYPKIPDILKGYVELVYDLNSQPSIRFIEGLLYNSPFYNRDSQTICLSLIDKDYRPFVLSTPRLTGNGYLHLKIPFADERLDELFRLKEQPKSFSEISELLELDTEQASSFRSLTTEQSPQPDDTRYRGPGVRVRYFGHACLLIETEKVSILTDPLISYKYDSEIPRYTYGDLPRVIDYALITHNHLDHMVLESLLQLRHRIRNVVVPHNTGGFLADPSPRLLLKRLGFKNVIEVSELETSDVDGGQITGLPFIGEHHDLNIRSRIGYLLRLNEKTICIAADSCNLEPKICENINGILGDVDVLFIGMECDGAPLSWFYGALLTKPLDRKMDYSRQGSASNHQRAFSMVKELHCKQVFIYAMGLEPWLTYILSIDFDDNSTQIVESNNFIADCRNRGIPAERLFGQKEIYL